MTYIAKTTEKFRQRRRHKTYGKCIDDKVKRCLSVRFCCHLHCPLIFPSSSHLVNISDCSSWASYCQSWPMISPSVTYICSLHCPFIYYVIFSIIMICCGQPVVLFWSVCGPLWFIVIISYTLSIINIKINFYAKSL